MIMDQIAKLILTKLLGLFALTFAGSGLNVGLNEAAIAEKRPAATRFNNIIHPHPERDFLYFTMRMNRNDI